MADFEGNYLQQCAAKNQCPTCQQSLPFDSRFPFEGGIFCSLTCVAKWNEQILIARHQARTKKAEPNE